MNRIARFLVLSSVGVAAVGLDARAVRACDACRVKPTGGERVVLDPNRRAEEALDREVDRRLQESLRLEYGDLGREPGYGSPRRPVYPRGYSEPRVEPAPERMEDIFEPSLGFRATFWFAQLDSLVVMSEVNSVGDEIELTDEMDFQPGDFEDAARGDDFESSVTPRLGIVLDIHQNVTIDGDYSYAEFSSVDPVTETFLFDGQFLFAGEDLRTRADFSAGDLDVQIHFIREDWIRLGIDLGAKYYSYHLQIRRVAGGAKLEQDLDGTIPYVGAHFSLLPASFLELAVAAKAGAWSLGDEEDGRDVGALDLSLSASLHLAEWISLTGGWRYESGFIERRKDFDVELAEWEISGVFGEVAIRF